MDRTFEMIEIDETEARGVIGGLLIPNFLDALQRTGGNADPSFLMNPLGEVLN